MDQLMVTVITSAVAPAVIAAVSALFAALISVTDSVVNNYGECTIDINEGKRQLTVQGGSNMLVTLANEGVFVPSACGGSGSCAECKVKVTSDIGEVLPTELALLSDEHVKDSIRLACQNKVRGDVNIEIPESLFNCRRYENCTVTKMEKVTHDIYELHIKLPEGESIEYVAGQYVQLEAPPYNKIKSATQRAYSMASNPSSKDTVELLVRLVPGGILTTYVHEHLHEKDPINFVGPFGEFYVRDTGATMICVAGGSGMAPFKSIFKRMIESGEIHTREVWYFFGAVKQRDMYYLDWLGELDKQYEKFHFVPALSDPDDGDVWSGPVGLITEVLDGYLKKEIDADKPKEGYLCGSPGMLDACIAVMQKNDMAEETIYFDKFA